MFALLSPTLWKYAAILATVCAVLFGTYETGHSKGYAQGYQTSDAISAPIIKNLQDIISTSRTNQAIKAQTVIAESNTLNANIALAKIANVASNNAIAKHYTPAYIYKTSAKSKLGSNTLEATPPLDYQWIIDGTNKMIDNTFGNS